MARPVRLLHLAGSPTSQFFADLSRLYARGCLEDVAGPAGFESMVAHVSPGGVWRFPDGLSDEALAAAPPISLAAALAHLESLRPDVALPQLFCAAGMTSYRALLEAIGVPFVGNTAQAMALGAHKPTARAVVAAAGVAVPAGEVVRRGQRPHRTSLPVVVKPAGADNSTGIGLVRSSEDLPAALEAAFGHDEQVLVEDYVPLGREVRCAVLDLDGDLQVLPLEEYAVDEATKPIRDERDKLAPQAGGGLRLVAKDAEHAWIVDPGDPVCAEVGPAAIAAHRALGCRDYSLFDFRIDPSGRPWFLEAGLYCSFSPQSVVAVMAAAAGIGPGELLARCIRQAMSRTTG